MKSKLIAIIIILLALTVGWLISRSLSSKKAISENIEIIDDQFPQRGIRSIGNFLELTPEQFGVFSIIERQYRTDVRDLMEKLRISEVSFLTELSLENPDTITVFELTNEIGLHHAKLKRLTANHFLALRSLCTDEQSVKLSKLFSRMERTSGFHRRGNRSKEHEPMRRRGGKNGSTN